MVAIWRAIQNKTANSYTYNPGHGTNQLRAPRGLPDEVGLQERQPLAGLLLEQLREIHEVVQSTGGHGLVGDGLNIAEFGAGKRRLQYPDIRRDVAHDLCSRIAA